MALTALYLCALVACGAAFPFQIPAIDWTVDMNPIHNFSTNMKSFFDVQKNRVEQAFTASYQEAVRVGNTVNNFVEGQGEKFSTDMNNYVESIKESGRKVADSWSYMDTEESGARMSSPDVNLCVPSIISRHGYPCETHTVVSRGYMLNVHRIPRSRNRRETPERSVILQHGLFASSADWILNGPDKGLAYVLADAGYDVWMPNIRGNKYSKEHAVFKTNSKAFWNFTWHDVAAHDLPTIIDHVVKEKSDGVKISYIGHSMGTTILFAMLTLRPEYNEILSAGLALAPVAFFTDLKSPVKALAPHASNVAYMEMLYGAHEFVPKDSILGMISSSCSVDRLDSLLCKKALFYICGQNEEQFNKSLLPVFVSKLGTGTSWKTAVHYAQEVTSGGRFQQFDYGKRDNLRVYGKEQPPEYDLSKITLPIKLFWAENDLLSSQKDVQLLFEKLPSTAEIYKIPDANFNHLDYLWAIDTPTLLNNEILVTLNKVH